MEVGRNFSHLRASRPSRTSRPTLAEASPFAPVAAHRPPFAAVPHAPRMRLVELRRTVQERTRQAIAPPRQGGANPHRLAVEAGANRPPSTSTERNRAFAAAPHAAARPCAHPSRAPAPDSRGSAAGDRSAPALLQRPLRVNSKRLKTALASSPIRRPCCLPTTRRISRP